MTNRQAIVHTFPSTTWEYRKVKLAGPRPGKAQRRSASEGTFRVGRRDERKPLCVEVSYRGGPEAVWVLRSRGHEWRVSGAQALHDVLLGVNGPFFRQVAPG